jgi:hypothetical protein
MRYVPDVEAVMQALLLLLQNVQCDPDIQTVTRTWQPWEQLADLQQPAIVIVEPEEDEKARRGQQSAITLEVQLIIYARGSNTDLQNPPSKILNSIIKGIRTALLPSGSGLGSNVQDLGGLVSSCFISGKIKKDAGVLDEQMSAIVPITITLP